MLSTIFLVFIVFLLVMVVAANVRIVPQANVYVIERLGTYLCTWGAGLHIKTRRCSPTASSSRSPR